MKPIILCNIILLLIPYSKIVHSYVIPEESVDGVSNGDNNNNVNNNVLNDGNYINI